VRFAVYTGLRAGELAALRIRDVNFLRRHVEVRRTVQGTRGGWSFGTPKSARSARDVPLSRELLVELAACLEQHPHRLQPDAALWLGRTSAVRPVSRIG
jgi:integrase